MDPSYNNFSRPAVNSGAGDIMLPTEQKPKRRGLAIALIIVAVLLVGVLVGVLVWRAMNPETTNTSSELMKKYNIVANYALTGVATNKDIEGVYAEDAEYYLTAQATGEDADAEARKEFFKRLNEYWTDFYMSFEQSSYDSGSYSVLMARIYTLQQDLPFLALYYDTDFLTSEEVWNMYFRDGKEQTLNVVKKSYQPFLESNSDVAREFGGYAIELGEKMVDQLETMDAAGCIIDRKVDTSCMVGLNLNSASYLQAVVSSYAANMLPTIEQSMFIISEQLKNPMEFTGEEVTNEN